MQAPNILCNIPILFAVCRMISRGSRLPAITFRFPNKVCRSHETEFLELAPPVIKGLRTFPNVRFSNSIVRLSSISFGHRTQSNSQKKIHKSNQIERSIRFFDQTISNSPKNVNGTKIELSVFKLLMMNTYV